MASSFSSRQVAMAIVPKISALGSVGGSAFVVVDILRSHCGNRRASLAGTKRARAAQQRTLYRSSFYRIILALSVADFVSSCALFFTTWPIPKDRDDEAGEGQLDGASSPMVYGNVGNAQTCAVQGFFIQLGIVPPFYNALLSSYYYLTIARGWKEADFCRVEVPGHVLAMGFGVGTATAGLVLDLYRNANLWCWLASEPALWRWVFFYGPLWVTICLVAILMGAVGLYVWRLEVRVRRYTRKYSVEAIASRANAPQTNDNSDDANRHHPQQEPQQQQNRRRHTERGNDRSRAVLQQGLFYAGTFALVWVFGTIVRAMQLAGAEPPWAMLFLFAVFTPSQGFFNFLVYVRPRLIRYGERQKKKKAVGKNERQAMGQTQASHHGVGTTARTHPEADNHDDEHRHPKDSPSLPLPSADATA